MARRLVAAPPDLPGYTYVRPLGSGGFADVYCFEQHMPRRTVAVKVLLAGISGANVQQMFLAEATLMAQLSSHPSVLTVYEASLCADGRPYLVMEYCPTGYGDRFRTETIPLGEVLRVAIAVGSVLETAHREQVLHRDIKPGNILITQYGRPVLADFGIAASVAESAGNEVSGMSIPWSAPEVLWGRIGGTVQTEVWGFAATIYALLAGRSPFEVPGAQNDRESVQERILGRDTVRPTGRRDVPPTLEKALARALSKDPAKRQGSILDVLHTLQLVESELGIRPTPLDIPTEKVLDVARPSELPASASRTGGTTDGSPRRVRTRAPGRRGSSGTVTGTQPGSASGATVLRAFAPDGRSARRRRRNLVVGIGAGAVVLVAATVAIVLALTGRMSPIPQVTEVTATTTTSSIEFSWDDPGLHDGDAYLVRVDDGPGSRQQSTTFTVDTTRRTGRVCLTVSVVRDGRTGPTSEAKCAEG